ncbi:MAG: CBS domain-containing protein [Rhodocyclaceae bacterium]|nr:CBS domain-containing protein [Rhodocyclaceae bacterium]
MSEKSGSIEALLQSSIGFLRQYPPFDEMDEANLRFLASHLSLAYYASGSAILAHADGLPNCLFIVQRGTVQLHPSEGFHVSNANVLALGPGSCFSVYALMERRAVSSPYTAVEDTFCYRLPAEIFNELLHRSQRFQEFSTHYLRSLLRDSRRLIQMHSASAAAEQQAMNRSLRSLIKVSPIFCTADTTLETVLRTMHQSRVGSMLVVDANHAPVGIFTRSDVLDRVTLAQRPLTDAISAVMTPNPASLPADASVYEATLAIAARGIRHLPIVDDGRLVGIITERDLFALQRVSVRGINRVITQAQDAAALEQAGRDVRKLASTLFAQGVVAEQLTHLITTLNDALSQRAVTLVQNEHDLNGIRWCWLSFGSEGRLEQTVSTDQDNGIVFEYEPQLQLDEVRARLLSFAKAVNDLLDRCGFPLCTGDIMASNPRWCLTFDEWQAQFRDWVSNTDPEALLGSVIFFDFRALAGDETLGVQLRDALNNLAKANPRFLRQLVQYALETKPPLGLIRDFVTEEDGDAAGFIDLKKSAARLFVDAARIMALATGSTATNTAQRLRMSGASLKISDADTASAIEAFYFVQQLRLRSQLSTEAESTRTLANRIDPETLNEIDRRILKESLRQARKLQSRLALDYQL